VAQQAQVARQAPAGCRCGLLAHAGVEAAGVHMPAHHQEVLLLLLVLLLVRPL
jgi:hypothetical protein